METKIINQLQQYVPTLLMKPVTPGIPKLIFRFVFILSFKLATHFFIFFIYDTRKVRFFIVNKK